MKKIRNHRKLQPAYMVILGDGEMAQETVSLRARNGDQVADLPLQDFVDLLLHEIETKVTQPSLVPTQDE
jgi:threonyl-tRNA synthetase